MSIKLKGSSDGSVSLDAPADTSPTGTDVSLTLPTSAGSANQFIKNGSTAGELEHSSMVEDSSGRVGIGTTSPAQVLDVQISSTNSSRVFTNKSGGGSVFAGWNIDAGSVANGRAQCNFHHGSTQVATLYSTWDGSAMTGFNVRTFSTAGTIQLKVNSNTRIEATNSGAVITGSLSKSSGSFRIDHPLPSRAATHDLVHSFVEAPDASNLYAGMVDLVDGTATVNIDTAHRMTEGTFEALNTVQSWSSSNESGYAPVKCSISGNLLTIECQDATSTDTVYYEVRGVRKDQHMLDTEWTDENGRVITEPLKESDNTEAAS